MHYRCHITIEWQQSIYLGVEQYSIRLWMCLHISDSDFQVYRKYVWYFEKELHKYLKQGMQASKHICDLKAL